MFNYDAESVGAGITPVPVITTGFKGLPYFARVVAARSSPNV